MCLYLALILIVYIIGIPVAYKKMESWDHNKFEKACFSIIWPLVLILYGIHYLHNNM